MHAHVPTFIFIYTDRNEINNVEGKKGNDNDNELFIQTKSNWKYHGRSNNNISIKKIFVCSCQEDCIEYSMAAGIQPPG